MHRDGYKTQLMSEKAPSVLQKSEMEMQRQPSQGRIYVSSTEGLEKMHIPPLCAWMDSFNSGLFEKFYIMKYCAYSAVEN